MPISAPAPTWATIKNKPANFDTQAGTVAYFAAGSAPSGWLKANGAAVSRTTYSALFAAIGTTFGAGDGSTTFALPDLRGYFVRPLDDGRGVDSGRTLGTSQADDLKSHVHAVAGNTSNSSGSPYRILSNTNSTPNVTNDTNATGGTETRPKNVALLACIKY